jgi:hypothetical protein
VSKNKDFLNMCLSLQYNHNFQFHLINFISFWSLSLKFQGEILECNFPESSYFLTCKFIYPLVTLTRLLEVETFDVFLASSNRFLLQSCIVHKKLISKLQTIFMSAIFIDVSESTNWCYVNNKQDNVPKTFIFAIMLLDLISFCLSRTSAIQCSLLYICLYIRYIFVI